jgi:hypothetical protein
MATMNKPADGEPNWYRAVNDNWSSIERNLLDNSVVAAKGDLVVASGPRSPSNQPVGSDGLVLLADSTQGLGMRWASINGTGYVTVQNVRATTSTSTSSTTDGDMDSMSISVTVGASDKVLVMFSASIEGGTNANNCTLTLLRGTTALQVLTIGSAASPWGNAATLSVLDQPGAGTFTYKVQWRIDSGTARQDLAPFSTNGDRMIAVVVLPA